MSEPEKKNGTAIPPEMLHDNDRGMEQPILDKPIPAADALADAVRERKPQVGEATAINLINAPFQWETVVILAKAGNKQIIAFHGQPIPNAPLGAESLNFIDIFGLLNVAREDIELAFQQNKVQQQMAAQEEQERRRVLTADDLRRRGGRH